MKAAVDAQSVLEKIKTKVCAYVWVEVGSIHTYMP